MIDQDLTQSAFTTILQHFVAKGRAPHYAELAEALDIGSEEAREVQRAAVEAAASEVERDAKGLRKALKERLGLELRCGGHGATRGGGDPSHPAGVKSTTARGACHHRYAKPAPANTSDRVSTV